MAKKKSAAKKPSAGGKQISFKSKMVNWAEGMDYCAIPVPPTVTAKLGTKAAVLVMARVNDSAPFKVSVFPVGEGKHFIRVRKRVRVAAGLAEGDSVTVHITTLDRDADAVILKDLEKALRAEDVLADFKSIPPGARNFLIRKIDDAVKPETRSKRIEEAVEAAHKRREKSA